MNVEDIKKEITSIGAKRAQQVWDKNLIKAFKEDKNIAYLLYVFLCDAVKRDVEGTLVDHYEELIDFMLNLKLKRFRFVKAEDGRVVFPLKSKVRPYVCMCSERLGCNLLTAVSGDKTMLFDILLNINNYKWRVMKQKENGKRRSARRTIKAEGSRLYARQLSAGWSNVK